MSCSFSVCSLITDVRESVTDIPREPDEVKSLLLEHLGFGGKTNDAGIVGGATTNTISEKMYCNNTFKHPISYTNPDKLHELPTSIIEDLDWAIENDKWNISKENYINNGVVKLA